MCAPNVLQEVNFPKSFFEQMYTGWIVVLHRILRFFSMASDGVANYASIWTFFSLFVRGPYGRRLRFSSDADIVRLTNARIIIIMCLTKH